MGRDHRICPAEPDERTGSRRILDGERCHWEQRNPIVYEQNRDRTLENVLSDSARQFQQLLEGVQAQSEAFLTEPQEFEGAPGSVLVGQMIRGDVYDHYGLHIHDINNWLGSSQTQFIADRS